MIKLYSTGCPKCKVLKQKLDDKQIDYQTISDVDTIIGMGFEYVPVLEVDGKNMDFSSAVKWINERIEK